MKERYIGVNMGKLLKSLEYQLKTEHKEDAEKCLIIYNYLKDRHDGCIWQSNWNPLVSTSFIGKYPNSKRISKPTYLGNLVIKDIKEGLKTE